MAQVLTKTGALSISYFMHHSCPYSIYHADGTSRGYQRILNRPEQLPGVTLDVGVVAREFLRQTGKASGDFGVALFHQRRTAVDRAGDGEILVRNAPKQFSADGGLGVVGVVDTVA